MVAGTHRLAAGLVALAMTGERASGIMFWKLDDDIMDASFLLGVIRGTIEGAPAEP